MPILNVNHLSKVYGSKQKYKALRHQLFSGQRRIRRHNGTFRFR